MVINPGFQLQTERTRFRVSRSTEGNSEAWLGFRYFGSGEMK